ncbi:MAG: glycosyltransferase family 2 protein [Gammaproteobacteria bacterium]|nr:glycosyltransferase family 2 protein [Gammaproteobacteria bacterium]
MTLLFWFFALLLLYIYIGYPLLARHLATSRPRPIARSEALPKVTILTAAFNEAKEIEQTIRNKMALDYPAELLEMIVISDESEDGTDEIVQRLAAESPIALRLIRQSPRQGKTAALNLAVPEASGEILLFADANSLYAPDALRRLVANFGDPHVGYVTGQMLYTNPDGSLVGDGCSGYMRFENKLRSWESAFGSIVGVDGGVDAMRRAIYRPMRADQLPDFVQPLQVVAQGYRVVYEPQAVLQEHTLTDAGREYRMRVRVALRALWAMWDMRELFNPLRHGLFAWQLLSHKLLRYLAFVPLIGVLLSNLALLAAPFYKLTLACQLLFYIAAYLGWRKGSAEAPALVTVPYYFTLINWACAEAAWMFVQGKKIALWKPREG